MPAYDAQVVINFDLFDRTTFASADILTKRGNVAFGTFNKTIHLNERERDGRYSEKFKTSYRDLGNAREVRLYLVGHGNWRTHTLSGWSPEEVSNVVIAAGQGNVGRFKVISIVACGLGADRDASEEVRMSESRDSFAVKLHTTLNEKGHRTTIFARLWNVVVAGVRTEPWLETGRKYVVPVGASMGANSLAGSKIKVFFDKSGKQQRVQVEYLKSTSYESQD